MDLGSIDFDKEAFLKEMDDNAKETMKEAAKAWLKAAITRVPVYTGTALSSLKPIGAFVGQAVPSGKGQGTFAFEDNNYEYSFSVDTDVFYYKINEYYDVSQYIHLIHPGPWGSFEAGDNAADQVINESDVYPGITDFIDWS